MLSDAIHEVPYIAEPVEVGRGGFAIVHRATDLQADRPVAVKLLSFRSDDADLKSFDRERDSLARLSTHPNVVTLHRTGVTTGGVPYLVMEFASGGSLADRLKTDGPFPWADAVDWILPICDALDHAHGQGIRHRDVKPQNILISAHGKPLLSDFGIAGLTTGTETVTHRAKLSLSYASPEQIDGRELGDSTDVYSLGVTLYTLLTGAPPFADTAGLGFLNTAKRILEEQPPSLNVAVPVEIESAIRAAMAKNPMLRPTVDDFRRALQQEIVLDVPPPDDKLPARATEVQRPIVVMADPAAVGPVGADGNTSVLGTPKDTGDVDSEGPNVASRSSGRRRTLSAAVVVLVLLGGFAAAAWTRFDGDSAPPGEDGVADNALASEVGSETVSAVSSTITPTSTGTTSTATTDTAAAVPAVSVIPTTTVAPTTLNPTSTVADLDGDGAADAEDNCPEIANRDQANSDGDADGDACDPDDDNDGVSDADDNCPVVANADQADGDGDDLGDACDDFPDLDGDGIIDTNDSCIEPPGAPDTDGDGVPDACDDSPRGMVVVAASAQIDRVTITNMAYGDGEADMFGDLVVDGTKFNLPEIANSREIRPGNWFSGQVPIEPGSPLIRVRVWIRDEDRCLFCRDGLVDITPESGMNALQLLIDTETGAVDLATGSWNRLETIGTLTGSADGDLAGTITQSGDNDEVHLASMDLSLNLYRQPAP